MNSQKAISFFFLVVVVGGRIGSISASEVEDTGCSSCLVGAQPGPGQLPLKYTRNYLCIIQLKDYVCSWLVVIW